MNTALPYIYKELSAERIVLRRLKKDDAPAIFSLRSNPEVNRYIGRAPQTKIEEAFAFIEKINKGIDDETAYDWVIEIKNNNQMAGTICLWNISDDRRSGEIGYELLPEYQGKGIMKEAIGLLLKFIFDELQMQAVNAYTHKDNLPSNKLLSLFGFRQQDQNDPENENNLIYTLVKH
jgi:ribosomal-protein-alanine N-acetyltransferase